MCECGELNAVRSGKSHRINGAGVPIYDVNTKVASAMIHSGISQTAVRRFTSAMELPTPSVVTLKRREREIGPAFEKTAKEVCDSALVNETILNGQRDEQWFA